MTAVSPVGPAPVGTAVSPVGPTPASPAPVGPPPPRQVARRLNLVGALFGAGFGFVLAAARLHEYDTIHSMLRLDEPDVFFLMGSAIATAMPLLWWLERRRAITLYGGPIAIARSRPERHHVIGGALFGAGWALAGTCPAPALVMLSSGAGLAVVAIGGLFVGMRLRDRHAVALIVGDGEHRSLGPSCT